MVKKFLVCFVVQSVASLPVMVIGLRARNLESGTTNYVLKHKAASSSFVANVCDRNCYTFLF